MNINKVNIIYFSPTQSTKRIVQIVASKIGIKVPTKHISVTTVNEREKQYSFESDELIILATPAYGGRIPQVAPALFDNLKGNNTPIILIVVYGNVAYGDALLELKDLTTDKGFLCVGAAAFVAQHAASKKIGTNRPNADDILKMNEFSNLISKKLNNDETAMLTPSIPGDFPYRDLPPRPPIAPITNEKCIQCLLCFRWCPNSAIAVNEPKVSDISKCIRCQGCVVRCPVSAREITHEGFIQKVHSIEEQYSDNVCEPEFFL